MKAILQGGEKHTLTGHSFVAHANYDTASGRDATRVVSCNTTATVRTLAALKPAGLLTKARGVLIRRATDPSTPPSSSWRPAEPRSSRNRPSSLTAFATVLSAIPPAT